MQSVQFGSKNIVGQNIFWVQKIGGRKNFGESSNKILSKKLFGSKIFSSKKNVGPKFFWGKAFLVHKTILSPKNFLAKKNFESK